MRLENCKEPQATKMATEKGTHFPNLGILKRQLSPTRTAKD